MVPGQKSHKDDLKTLWSVFCRRHFQSAAHVAVFFDVTEQTARNWIEGSHAPAGWAVNRAWSEMPAEALQGLRLVVDNPKRPAGPWKKSVEAA